MTTPPLSCLDFEAALSDYREGALPTAEAAALRRHLAGCAQCAALFEAVEAAARGLHSLPRVAPPPRLLASILAQTLPPPPPRRGWAFWRLHIDLHRLSLGLAMSVFAFALALNAAQVNLRHVFAPGGIDALAPNRLASTVERQFSRAWARGVSYYDDLRVVYEIEAAIHEMRQPQPPPAPPGRSHTRGSRRSPRGRSQREEAAKFRLADRPQQSTRRGPGRAGALGSPARPSVSGSRGLAARGPAPVNSQLPLAASAPEGTQS